MKNSVATLVVAVGIASIAVIIGACVSQMDNCTASAPRSITSGPDPSVGRLVLAPRLREPEYQDLRLLSVNPKPRRADEPLLMDHREAGKPKPGEILIGKNVGVLDDGRPAAREAPATAATDELWIIQRPQPNLTQPGDDTPGCGALVTRPPGETRDVPVPLKHTDVRASVAGYIASVEVIQQFHNPFSSKIEAVYVFPLPENAGVNEFLMTIGDRTIRGIVREREEAQKIYTQARAAGYVASLMTQERPNIFTQKVANIEPGKSIDISIKYFNTLAYYDGWYQFVFPMVVGPRFNPPGSTDGVGAVARGDLGASGQKTEVQYLKPGERSGHDVSVSLDIDAGVTIEEVRSRSHVVETSRPEPNSAKVRLASSDTIPNRDFVVAWRVAGDKVKSSLLTHRDSRGGYFTMMLVPPKDLDSLQRAPMEMVFVVDRSGSMKGHPIQQARDAAERGLKNLQPGDTFQVIDFSNDASQFGSYPVEATARNLAKGLDYVESLDAAGGTMMMRGLKAALDFPHDPQRLRVVAFLTDGYIGNEGEILGELHRALGSSRIFSFGVGTSVNRYLMDSMAKMGRGAAAYLAAGDPAAEPMDLFFQRVSHPALTDLSIDWGAARVSEVYPTQIPDLFVGRPVILTGRFDGDFDGKVLIRGRAGGRDIQIAVSKDDTGTPAALPTVWARMKIADLSDRSTWDADGSLRGQVRQVALDYGLLSEFTSFVAVDSMTRTAGESGTTVDVPVLVPQGVRYDTTVVEQPQSVTNRR